MSAYRYRVTAVNEDHSKRYWYWVGTDYTSVAGMYFVSAMFSDRVDYWISQGCTRVLLEDRDSDFSWSEYVSYSLVK